MLDPALASQQPTHRATLARRTTQWEDRHGNQQVAVFDAITWDKGGTSFEVVVFGKRHIVADASRLDQIASMSPAQLAENFSR